jgi:2'-hydroxyisoflavone reductase
MQLLVIGGTRFVGRHLVEAALARGHSITLFNRGQSNPDLFPQIERLHGDRDGDVWPLKDRQWDAVIDTCGYVPRIVRKSVELLANAVDHYTFISSISVYAEDGPIGMNEDSPVGTLSDETIETITDQTYGPLKVLCERAVQQHFADRALIVRPGLIVGPHDPTDRFTYWPHRIARGGEVLAPGDPQQPVQFIDVRDLGDWIVRMIESRQGGAFNATGPNYTLPMNQLLEECVQVANSDAHLTWVDEKFLIEAGVAAWSDLPVWAGEKELSFVTIDCSRAMARGLTFHSLATTIRDTLTWDAARPGDHAWRAGLNPEREAAVLSAWHGTH